MPNFNYIAISKSGQKETASIEAPNLAAAGHLLKEQGLLPTEIKEENKKSSIDFLKNFSSISFDEKIGFVENLGVMLKAGIAISRALQILVKQSSNPRFKTILTDVYSQVEQGKGLGEALQKYPKVFPNIVISMINVGEVSGNLDKSLEYVSIQLHRQADLKSKVKGAMIYPAVIVSAMFVIGILMSIFVLPSLTSIFSENSVALPFTTQMVVDFSNFMSGHAVLAIGGMIAFFAFAAFAIQTKVGKRSLDFVSLHFMIINNVVKKVNLAMFSRILSSLLKSGLPIIQALDVAGSSLDNVFYQELIAQAATEVKVGKPVAESLGKNLNLFPVLVVQMIQVGEESGSMQEILEQLAGHYEQEVDDTLKNLSSIIEPLLILVIGGIVGLLALALISPIYSIYQNAQ